MSHQHSIHQQQSVASANNNVALMNVNNGNAAGHVLRVAGHGSIAIVLYHIQALPPWYDQRADVVRVVSPRQVTSLVDLQCLDIHVNAAQMYLIREADGQEIRVPTTRDQAKVSIRCSFSPADAQAVLDYARNVRSPLNTPMAIWTMSVLAMPRAEGILCCEHAMRAAERLMMQDLIPFHEQHYIQVCKDMWSQVLPLRTYRTAEQWTEIEESLSDEINITFRRTYNISEEEIGKTFSVDHTLDSLLFLTNSWWDAWKSGDHTRFMQTPAGWRAAIDPRFA